MDMTFEDTIRGSVAILRLQPGDTVVFITPEYLGVQETIGIHAALKEIFPYNRSIILDKGNRIETLSREAP